MKSVFHRTGRKSLQPHPACRRMRVVLVLAFLAVLTAGVVAVATPAAAISTCSPVYALEHSGPEAAVDCVQSNLNPCHFAYPHPCL